MVYNTVMEEKDERNPDAFVTDHNGKRVYMESEDRPKAKKRKPVDPQSQASRRDFLTNEDSVLGRLKSLFPKK